MRVRDLIAAAAAFVGVSASAQPALLSQALEAGTVGERYDGYLGFATPPPEALRRQVSAINIHRRNLYIELASRRNVTADAVGLTAACELLARVPVGGAYQLKDAAWQRRAAGQPAPVPNYCR
jgi:uncharacterized protein YdbL (DUF1318 family)